MKLKKITLSIAVAIITLGAYAQSGTTNGRWDQSDNRYYPDFEDQQSPDGYMYQNGRMLVIRNGRMTEVDKNITLSNGTVITSNGSYTSNGGASTMFKDGEYMDMSGKMTKYNSSTYSQNYRSQMYPEGYMYQNGVLSRVGNGETTPIYNDITLSNGTVIASNGSYTEGNGTNTRFRDGEHMDMSGTLTHYNSYSDTQGYNNHNYPDGYLFQNGKVVLVKDGKLTPTDNSVTLSNGTVITSQGNYTKKGGANTRFHDGEHMDMSGKMSHYNSTSDRQYSNHLNYPDGYLFQNGKVMKINRGMLTPTESDITLNNGTVITSKGNYTKKGGINMMFKDGEHMDMSGKMTRYNTSHWRYNSDQSYPDGYLFQNGKVVSVKNGIISPADKDITLNNGTVITSKGNYTKKGGTNTMFQDGEHMDLSGNMTRYNTSHRQYANDQSYPDGYLFQNGKVFMVKNGIVSPSAKEITLNNGTVITTRGNYTKKGGTNTMFQDGEHMDMSGNVTRYNTSYRQSYKDHSYPDGYLFQNGKVVLVKNGIMSPTDKDITLNNGTVITSQGNYTVKGGSKMDFKEGDHMDMSGNINQKSKIKSFDENEKSNKNMYWLRDSTKKDGK